MLTLVEEGLDVRLPILHRDLLLAQRLFHELVEHTVLFVGVNILLVAEDLL